jgi:DNA-directed RNA polymerase specialized sigma24 family protein
MAQGGIVALAAGGTSYQDLTKDSTPEQIASAYKSFTTAGGGDTQANRDAAIAYLGNLGIASPTIGQAYEQFQAAPTYTQFSNEQIGGYLAANPNADIAAATAQLNADPRAVNQYISQLGQGFLDPTQTAGGSGSGQYFDTFSKYGIDANELLSANKALNPGATFAGDTGGIGRAFETAKDFKGFDPQGETQLLKDIEWVKQMDATGSNTFDIARLTGLSIGEVAAREAAAREAMKVKPPIIKPPVITGIPTPEGTTLPGGVSGGGNTVVNPDGTITTAPNIPGRPEGGFTGMGQVRDVYTQGGGSLGYVNPAPKTMEEFEQRFNRQTGDSLAAYEYLMGRGANPATQQRVGEIARPYSEAIVGIPAAAGRPNQKYIYENGRYIENPNYAPVTYDTKGNRVVGMTSAEVLKGLNALPDKTDDAAIFDWVDENQISIAQLAAAMKISVGEAQRRMNAAKKKAGATTATSVSDSGYGGGDTSPPPAPPAPDSISDMSDTVTAARGGVLPRRMALGGLGSLAGGGTASQYNLGGYSDGGRLLRGPGDGVSDSIPATIGNKQPARLADGEFVIPARIVSELGNGSTEAGARKLYAMMDRVQKARGKTTGKNRVAANTRADKYLPA